MTRKQQDPAMLEELANKILQLDIHTLMVDLRYLRVALQQLKPASDPEGSLATDGAYLYYAPQHILRRYKKDPAASARDYLHVVLHCIFRHMYLSYKVRPQYWDLACDIAVEHIISGLDLRSLAAERQKDQRSVLEELKQQIGALTAEKIYRWLLEQKLPKEKLGKMRRLFYADDHALWHLNVEEDDADDGDQEEKEPGDRQESGAEGAPKTEAEPQIDAFDAERREARAMMETIWADMARQVEMELASFNKASDGRADALTQNLLAVNREKYDYTAFLRKFAVRSEVMQIDPDTFDTVFYTYGLQLFGNIPLIEPLEYKEIRRIRTFVIAIDTSGSTTGALVQRFIQKTYNILQSTESFFSQIELYILQCDDEVREAVRVTSLEEFDAYMKTMQIRGHGGTDFRPVFSYVDDLRRRGELRDLRGLIYFTDGYGTFPQAKPVYDTAFVFVDDTYQRPEVPPWAMRLILRPEEI